MKKTRWEILVSKRVAFDTIMYRKVQCTLIWNQNLEHKQIRKLRDPGLTGRVEPAVKPRSFVTYGWYGMYQYDAKYDNLM